MFQERLIALLALGMVVLALGSCTKARQQTTLMESAEYVDVAANALRMRMYAFVIGSVGAIEHAANQIIAESDDPEVNQRALLWKINGAYELQLSAFQPDPLAATVDSWAFCMQMRGFFETGAGAELFGSHQQKAINASIDLESDMADIIRFATSDSMTYIEGLVTDWVSEHPIESLSLTRESISQLFLDEISQHGGGGLAAVASMNQSMHDLVNRMTIYGAQLPKQAQWQAEYLVNQKLEPGLIEDFFVAVGHVEGDIDSITGDIRNIRTVFDEVPALVDRERVALMQSIDDERIAVMNDLRQEREVILKAIREERIATMAQIEAMSQRMLGESPTYVNAAIDHFFWRALLLLAVLTVLGVVTGVVTLRLTRNLRRRA